MTSSDMWSASAISDWCTRTSTTSNFKTSMNGNAHTRHSSSSTYMPEVGSHLSSRELGPIILQIEVGSGKEPGGTVTFKAHAKLLYAKIPVLEYMVANTFEEFLDPVKEVPDVILANDDPKAFKLLVDWVYTDKIDGGLSKIASIENTTTPSKGSFKGLFMSMKLPILVKLCILAEKYHVSRLQDESIDFLIKFMIDTKARANPSCWLEVYKHTIPKSKLRLLISRIAVWQMSQVGGLDGVSDMDLESIFSRNEELRFDISTLTEDNMGVSLADPLLAPACDYYSD
ncbi:uncharacterized protein Bfra_011525 [Botrytis fragariae]|uniref:BTB domain-containing protein n=1 Tax=Botrytis fragariae TaxID=1964551 RepID=A0A8H6EKN6_9HELO|nr:uncharacterized protein Bfra_011525 [Botrytis fragariae]KAF5875763.1 hypothetical protein Bfra_011525 [Botrytis fragariae]